MSGSSIGEIWLLDVNNIRGKCGFPDLAAFCRAVERWHIGNQPTNALVVLAVDCGITAEALAVSDNMCICFSGVGAGSKDADTIIVHAVDAILHGSIVESSESIVRVVTSDNLLRQRCRHELPAWPRVVKPLGRPRSVAQLSRLRLEPRSEAFSARLSFSDISSKSVGISEGPFGDALFRQPQSHRKNKDNGGRRRRRKNRTRNDARASEDASARAQAASALHAALHTCCRRGRVLPEQITDCNTPAKCFEDWFHRQYPWAMSFRATKTNGAGSSDSDYDDENENKHKDNDENARNEKGFLTSSPSSIIKRIGSRWPLATPLLTWLGVLVATFFSWCSQHIREPSSCDNSRGCDDHFREGDDSRVEHSEQSGESNGGTQLSSEQTSIIDVPIHTCVEDNKLAVSDVPADWDVTVRIPREEAILSSPAIYRSDKFTLCVVSDTHGFESQGPHLPPADVLVHCGDFCNEYTSAADGRLDNWLASKRCIHIPVKIVIRGNHDAPHRWENRGVRRLPKSGAFLVGSNHKGHGKAHQFGSPAIFRIFRARQGESCDQGAGNGDDAVARSSNSVTLLALPWHGRRDGRSSASGQGSRQLRSKHAQMMRCLQSLPAADVIVSHVPPRGVLDLTVAGEHIGSEALAQVPLASRPAVWCFGHVHEQRGAVVATGLREAAREAKKGPLPATCAAATGAAASLVHGNDENISVSSVNGNVSPGMVHSGPTTLFLNAANANNGRAVRWPNDRPPILVRISKTNSVEPTRNSI